MHARDQLARGSKRRKGAAFQSGASNSTNYATPAANDPAALTDLFPKPNQLRVQVHEVLRAVIDPVKLDGGDASKHAAVSLPESPRLDSCSCSTCAAAALAAGQQPAPMCRVPLPEHLSSGYVTPEEELTPQDPEAQVQPLTCKPFCSCSLCHDLHQTWAWAIAG